MAYPKLKLRKPKLLNAEQSIRSLIEQRKLLASAESSSASSKPSPTP
jgi:hypothetical protein